MGSKNKHFGALLLSYLPFVTSSLSIPALILMSSTPSLVTLALRSSQTWKHIPQIRSHGQVEQKLDKCVQKLRRKILVDGRNRRAEEGESSGLGKRVPSFYTSPSLVNLSGLGVGDQLVLTSGIKNGRELNKSESSFGMEGAPTMDSQDSEESITQKGGQQVSEPGSPASSSSAPGIMEQGYIKSTSMAQFYYRRNKSGDTLSKMSGN